MYDNWEKIITDITEGLTDNGYVDAEAQGRAWGSKMLATGLNFQTRMPSWPPEKSMLLAAARVSTCPCRAQNMALRPGLS